MALVPGCPWPVGPILRNRRHLATLRTAEDGKIRSGEVRVPQLRRAGAAPLTPTVAIDPRHAAVAAAAATLPRQPDEGRGGPVVLFANRVDAGRQLAGRLQHVRD